MTAGYKLVAMLLVILASGSILTYTPATAGDVALPDIPRGQGDSCVEDTDVMRRKHMDMLMHQRDETVLSGVRGKQHSLKECLSCHVVTDEENVAVTYASPDHFCRSCHDYAAVKIDCFQCHASRPEVAMDMPVTESN